MTISSFWNLLHLQHRFKLNVSKTLSTGHAADALSAGRSACVAPREGGVVSDISYGVACCLNFSYAPPVRKCTCWHRWGTLSSECFLVLGDFHVFHSMAEDRMFCPSLFKGYSLWRRLLWGWENPGCPQNGPTFPSISLWFVYCHNVRSLKCKLLSSQAEGVTGDLWYLANKMLSGIFILTVFHFLNYWNEHSSAKWTPRVGCEGMGSG